MESGYEIKQDGTVIYNDTKEFIYKITVPPERFDFVFWYLHGFLE